MGDYSTLGDVAGKRVLVRSDLNVPLDGSTITDDGRIRASVPTIRELAAAGARVVVTAHLGRPKGAPEDRYSLRPVAARLGELGDGGDRRPDPAVVRDRRAVERHVEVGADQDALPGDVAEPGVVTHAYRVSPT